MSENISREEVLGYIQKVNDALKVDLNPEDFKSANYSVSSLQDILIQKAIDEIAGEWTSDMAFHKIKSALIATSGKSQSSITMDTPLNEIFPAAERKERIKKLSDALGIPLDVLKPNSVLNSIFIFLFFAAIPFGISMDWFLSGIAMIICAIVIFILSKTGNTFRMKTLGQMADDIAWKKYLKEKRAVQTPDPEVIRKKVEEIVV